MTRNSAARAARNASTPTQLPMGPDLSGQVRKTSKWPIGTGAFTDVYKGEWHKPRSPELRLAEPGLSDPIKYEVAIKIFRGVHTDENKREDMARRLTRESRTWYKLDHENVQPYHGYCECPDVGPSLSLIAPFCASGTLTHYLTKNPNSNRLTFVRHVACGLKYLHDSNVIHGDLHGNNVLVDETGKARLADFGRAIVIGHEGYSTALFVGSVEYMAPELFPEDEDWDKEEEQPFDPPFSKMSDVYAFGMLAYEIFTSRTPLQRGAEPNKVHSASVVNSIRRGNRPKRQHDLKKRISDDMWVLLEKCWTKEPEKRPVAAQIMKSIS